MYIDLNIESIPQGETRILTNEEVRRNIKTVLALTLKENFSQTEFQNQWIIKIWNKIYRICTHWKKPNRKIFLINWTQLFPANWAQKIKYNQDVNWIDCIKYRETIDSPWIYVDENLITIDTN